MVKGPQQEFYQSGYSVTRVYSSRWSWLDRWFPAISRWDLADSLLPTGCRLLDVGCGGGHLLLKASERYEELYGLDIAPVCITSAQQLLGGLKERKVDLRVVNIDVEGLPFAEAYFDAVTMIAVLQLVFDVERAIREVHRVLRAKGTFIFETNNLAYIGHRLTLLLGRQPRTSYFQGWDGNVLHYFVLGPLVALLEREGFSVIKVCSAGRFSNIRSWRPSLFAQNLMIVAVKE